MTTPDTPEGLYPGPDGTYYGRRCDVPQGWQYRTYDADDQWFTAADKQGSRHVVQCRPAPAPDTERVHAVDAVVLARRAPDGRTFAYLARNDRSLSGMSIFTADGTPIADPDDNGMVEVLREDPAPTEPAEAADTTTCQDSWCDCDKPAPEVPDPAPQGWTAVNDDPPYAAWLSGDVAFKADAHALSRAWTYATEESCAPAAAALVDAVRRANQPDPTAEQVTAQIAELDEAVAAYDCTPRGDMNRQVVAADRIIRCARDVLAAVAALREDGR